MARRYRYSFAKKKESSKGKWAVGIAVFSVFVFFAAFLFSLFLEQNRFVVGGLCLFAALLSIYGFFLGLSSFSEENCMHRTSIIGSIANGVFMAVWLGFYLIGM